MSIELIEIEGKADLTKFVKFQFSLYKGNPYFVPPIIQDELDTFLPSKNPAYENAEAKFFLAMDGGRIVGRIAGIISHAANDKWGTKNIRFGWIEMIDDFTVATSLYNAVEKWGKQKGMQTITGPHGFSDLDPQGMLVEGFDKLATIASYYHHPYYHHLTEKFGFEKDIDFIEFWSTPPYEQGIPEKMTKTAEWLEKRYNYKLLKYDNVKKYQQRGRELFELLEESFSENYGTVPLTQKQVDYYIKKYISFVNKDFLKVVVDESDKMIGFMISMPSLSKAYQKANGKLFPFGVFHLLKALKTYEVLDFYLAGVKKEYRGKGVDLIMALDIVKTAMNYKFAHAESNQELESNTNVQAQWKFFNPIQHKRRRIYKKNIE